jgi:hypothetical protein
LAMSVVGRGVAVIQGSVRIAGSSEALAWAYSSLRWAREHEKESLATLLEEVVTDLALEAALDGSSSPHHR